MVVDLSVRHFITVEDLLEDIIHALREGRPFSLTRWADSSNWIISHGRDPTPELIYREGRMTQACFEEYRLAFLRGVSECDVLGVFANDLWTKQMMAQAELDISGKRLVFAWCNKHIQSRREWADEVLGGEWRTVLVGNRIPVYRPWLEERFPRLQVVHSSTAWDWPEVAVCMKAIWDLRPQLVIACAGWYTSCLVGAARRAGAVGLSMGHMPDYHMGGHFPPNTEFPRGIEGNEAHCKKYIHNTDWIPQSREIDV